jgi:N-sulfoglucosamine sulfohydrolase
MTVFRTVAILLAALVPAAPLSAASKNVVLVVADDLGLDLGCYGNAAVKTPNLDRLAAEGTLYTHAFCTTASCSASRSVILSGMHNHANGQYGHEHGVHHFSSLAKVESLPVRLSKAGYRTARVGKFHVAPESVYRFDESLPGDARNGVQMADNCRAFVAATGERPFFLYFCPSDPHRGGGVGRGAMKPNLFGNEREYPGVMTEPFDPANVIVPPFLPASPACRVELAQYYRAISRLDQGIGRLVQVLQETGHWDDTLILFVSDNGMPFPGAKTTAYDAGLRLPCLVRNPYAKARGLRCGAMISWVDIVPTIMEFAGQPATGGNLQGRSFLGTLELSAATSFDEVYASHTFHEITMYYPMRVVRTRRHKLIWNVAHKLTFPSASDLFSSATWQDALSKGPSALYGKRSVAAYLARGEFELYDLETDPDETANLAFDAAHAETLKQLKAKLRQFQQRTRDPWITKWEYE